MKDHIIAVVEAGGEISFPYKTKLNEPFMSVKVGRLTPGLHRGDNLYFVYHPCREYDRFKTIEEAVDQAIKDVFVKTNVGLMIQGVRNHKLTDKQLDDLTDDEIRGLIKKYRDDHFATDYPWLRPLKKNVG